MNAHRCTHEPARMRRIDSGLFLHENLAGGEPPLNGGIVRAVGGGQRRRAQQQRKECYRLPARVCSRRPLLHAW
jgi:hypothetical protein